ncbi:MAG: metallophosphoesterase [Thermoanaerobaculia bacterium]
MRMRHGFGLPGPMLLVLAVAGCATTGSTPAPGQVVRAAPAPLAAYVLLGESPAGEAVAFARVILAAGQACPELIGRRAPIAMGKRLNPHGFEVDVCEAVVPFDRSLTVGEGGAALPVARREVRRVVVVGDTGCKPKDQAGCGLDDAAWPFQTLARAAAGRRPDLVLHVGDYNYRGTPSSFEQTVDGKQVKQWYYDAGDGAEPSEQCEMPGPYFSQNSTGNPDADAWQAWWLDFFQPAAELLAAAPWVVARGNHELCSHAGPGWFYFLDASSQLPEGGGSQLACPSQDGEGPALPHLVFAPPRVVTLRGLTVAVLDSANACDELPNFTATYAGQLAAVAARLDGSPAWLIGHRPVWGVEDAADGPPFGCDGQPGSGPAAPYAVLNRTLQCALAAEAGAALLPELDLLLAGHMHRFESLSFSPGAGRPPTLVVGNSGVQEDTGPPQGSFQQTVDGAEASGFSVSQFGFLELDRDGGGEWHGTVFTPDPAAWAPYLGPCDGSSSERPFLCVEGLD